MPSQPTTPAEWQAELERLRERQETHPTLERHLQIDHATRMLYAAGLRERGVGVRLSDEWSNLPTAAERLKQLEASVGNAGWGIRNADGEWLVDGHDSEADAWAALLAGRDA